MPTRDKTKSATNSCTPLILLIGVLVFSIAINFITIKYKLGCLALVSLVYLVTPTLKIKDLTGIWIRFRYLLLSVVLLNVVFQPTLLTIALDKVLLLLLMLGLVQSYLMVHTTDNITAAVNQLLAPLKLLGLNTLVMSELIAGTIQSVKQFQEIQKSPQSSSLVQNTSNNSLSNMAERLAVWVEFIEGDFTLKQNNNIQSCN